MARQGQGWTGMGTRIEMRMTGRGNGAIDREDRKWTWAKVPVSAAFVVGCRFYSRK